MDDAEATGGRIDRDGRVGGDVGQVDVVLGNVGVTVEIARTPDRLAVAVGAGRTPSTTARRGAAVARGADVE